MNIGPSNTVSPIFFIDAPGGTGKTFVLNTIAAYLRSKVKVVLANASNGNADILLARGCTAHARFNIPLKNILDTYCEVTARLDAGKTIISSDMIIWDESSMISKTVMASVYRLLQNLISNTNFLGIKVMDFPGDFCQCLPITVQQGHTVITSEVMKKCPWWNSCKQLRLTENEQLNRHGVNEANTRLADYLMELGNGTIPEVSHGCIRIPDQYVFESDNMDDFIDWAYPNISNGNVNSAYR